MKNVLKKIIAFMIVFVLVLNVESVALAETVKIVRKRRETKENQLLNSSIEQEELEIVGEQLEKRKLNEKHFTLSDGSTLVAMYPENVHYEKDGKMINIDNSLEETNEENGTVYKNKSNSYEVGFAKTSEEDKKIASFKSDGYEINWQMQSTKKEVKKEEKSQEVKEKAKEIEAKEQEIKKEIKEEIKQVEVKEEQKETQAQEETKQEINEETKQTEVKEEQKDIQAQEESKQEINEETKQTEVKEKQEETQIKEEPKEEIKEETKQVEVKEEQKEIQAQEEQKQEIKEEIKQTEVKEEQKETQIKEEQKQAEVKNEQKEIKEEVKQAEVKEEQKETQIKEEQKQTEVKEEIKKVNKANKVVAKIENKTEKSTKAKKTIDEQIKLQNVSSSIIYENILDKVDLKYDVRAEIVKESIIINDKEGLQDEFIFKFKTGDLKAELLETKEVVIYKENKENYTFKIDTPYMFDSGLEYSSDIEVTLKKDENTNEYILTIIPNKKWLEAEDRVYPITIDPTISTSRYFQDIKDTFIYDGDNSSDTRHNAHIIRIGNNNTSGPHKNPVRGLIKFTLPELNAGDQVIYASLNICSYPDTSEWIPPTREIQIDVHKMTSNWEEQSASWSNLSNSYNPIIEDYKKYKFDYNDQCKFYNFNITGIAKEWYTTGNNYGLMLKEHNEVYNYPDSDAYFISANTHTAFYEGRPVATIVYRNQTGLEGYLSYHTQSVGRAGIVYTNDYNGNLVLLHQDASTPGGRFPVSINHVFNTNDKETDIGYGKGFRLNLSQSIEFKTIDNVEYAKYIDEDGTAHYFKKNGDRYKDEDGLGLIIYKNGSTCTMEDKSKNKSTFTKNSNGTEIWYLTKVEDTEGNRVNISVDLRNGKITEVEDGANQKMQLKYDTPGKLETITDTNGRITKYTYNNSNLTNIKYSDQKTSKYEYSNNKLTNVINIDGSKIGYKYYEERTSRVKKIQEYGSNNEIGNSLQISYGDNSTIFTDKTGYSNTIIFNDFGNAVSVADFGKENKVDGAYGKMYAYGTSGGNKNKLTLESKMICIKDMPNNLVKNPYFNEDSYWTKSDACRVEDWVQNVDNVENTRAFRFLGESDRFKYIKQEVAVSGNKGDIFNISSWIKTQAAPNEDGKSVKVTLNIIGNDNSSQWVDIWANTDSSSWQFLSDQFITNYNYYRIDLYLICYLNVNTTYFDNIGLFKEDFGQSYTYDEKGNVVSTQDKAKNQSEFTYTDTNKLLSAVNPKGGKYVYEYDYNHKNRLKKAVNSTGIEYSFDYDNYGNTKSVKITEDRKSDAPENNAKYYMKVSTSDKYFDIVNSSTDNGAKLNQWENLGQKNQIFKLEDAGDGYFKIIATHTGKALDVTVTNNVITQWDPHGGTNQAWKFIENTDGTYKVISKSKGEDYSIALKDDSKENGGQIVLEQWQGKQSQKVELYKVNSDYNPIDSDKIESHEVYHIRAKHSNLYLENETNTVGGRIVQREYKQNDKNQLWRIIRLSNNHYKLSNLGSLYGNVIDVWDNNANHQELKMSTLQNSNVKQEWIIRGDQTGTYEIGTAMEGGERRLTVAGESKDAETPMVLYNSYGGSNQKFYLEKSDLFDVESGATYKIKEKQSGLFLGADSNNMLEIQNEGSERQEWIIENLNDGYYKFKLKGNAGKVMDVCGANTDWGTRIQVYNDTGSDAQKFDIVAETDGKYYIKPKINLGVTALNVIGGQKTAGAKIEHWKSEAWDSQRFELIKIESKYDKKYIEAKAEYTANGNYQTKLIDSSMNETSYEYNQNTGTLTKVTDAKGKATNYEYDGLDRVSKVSKQADGKTYQNQYTYENDRLKSIIHNGTNYYFEYDAFGNVKQTKIGNQVLGTNNYASNNGVLNSFKYGNGQQITYNYDRFDRVIKRTGTNGSTEYTYDAKGNVKTIKDSQNTQSNIYDLANRLIKKENTNGLNAQYWYDANSNVSRIEYNFGGKQENTWYNYDRDNRVSSTGTGKDLVVNNYDRLSRLISKETRNDAATTKYITKYTYFDTNIANKTTEKVKSIKNGDSKEISYTYDKNGNIETISKGEGQQKEETQKYYYDEINQLIREDNKELNKTIVYTYDIGGNIKSKKEYGYTKGSLTGASVLKTVNYTYGNSNWKDQLTEYNGKAITYDAIGNPLTYDGNTYTWQNGRELASLKKGNTTITYKYNASGIRTSKTVNGVETKYYLDGSKVIYEKTGEQDAIYYFYDESGAVAGLKYKNAQYYFTKNIQNDIIGILNSKLEQIVSYEYDSWGNVVSIKDKNGNAITDENNIGLVNPYRYRSYRYDSETKLYYLSSRYYNPEWGRFINADAVLNSGDELLGHNLYSYCNNNPINFEDSTGNSATLIITGLLVCAMACVAQLESTKTMVQKVEEVTGELLEKVREAINEGIKKIQKEIKERTVSNKVNVRNTYDMGDVERNTTVYLLTEGTTKVRYVGRTIDAERRKQEHQNNPAKKHLTFQAIPVKFTPVAARGVEQFLIMGFDTLKRGVPMYNQINGISLKNPRLGFYSWAAQLALEESEIYVGD